MKCSSCNGDSKVIDVVHNSDTNEIYRKRQCNECERKFYTVEFDVELTPSFKEEWLKCKRDRDAARRQKNKGE